ncbi:MAG: glycosyltransferase 87 family protein, partial [Candidatus Shapirobacteria bacterium]|nr:glycosyltransferase 87 family protein [Candidatus Shapirobacteria bacterium]
MKKILLLAMVFWGLLAPLTYHPDTKLTLRYSALENGKVWDIYSYLATHKLDIPDFHYPPAHYWWLKIHYPISKFIGGSGFDQWLASGSAQAAFNMEVMRYNLAAKFPLLLLGLISGWLIFKIVKRETKDLNKAELAALFWYFNPITLYSLVVMGQNDIVAIFLFLLGIWWIDRWWLMVLFWGLAAGVKNYPLIWAIMFLVVQEKKIFKLILKIGSVFLVYLVIMLPWLSKDYFIQAVLNSGLSQRMFIANIPIGFGKEI